MIVVKTSREIAIMREAGMIVSHILDHLKTLCLPGVTTRHLDQVAEKMLIQFHAVPSFKGYGGYPASICASVNDTLIHGIPSNQMLKDGDIISIDIGAYYKGYHADAARTYIIGRVREDVAKLVDITERSFFEALRVIRPGVPLSNIGHTIQSFVEAHGFSLPRDYTGHGVGQALHEDPPIPNYGLPNQGPLLKEGMTLAIEPMVNMGTYHTKVLDDEWTVKTVDGAWCAHYENTIVVTATGAEILTLNKEANAWEKKM